MRRILNYKMLLVIVLLVTASSCKKTFIELNSPTSLTPEQALGTEADLQVALRGAYAGLRGVDFYGRSMPIWGDIMADNAYQSALNTNRYTFFNDYSDTKGATAGDGNVSGLWASAYSVILRANNIINTTVASNANVDQYRGEAYAIRALAYFALVRHFAKPYSDDPAALGVPIVTTYNPDLKPARNKVSEVYTLMVDDLNKAYTLMTKYTNSSQFSKYAAKALQAKVYLNMGDKTNAKTAALDVINNGGFTSLTAASHASYWSNSVVTTSKLETLFEVSSDAVANLAFDALSYLYSQAGNYGDLLCADDLYASFEATDVRKALYPTGVRAGLAAAFVNKYPVIQGDLSDTKVLRLSEMYLIAAEASLPGNEADALTYVNYITSRRGATAIASTGAQLFEDIITERRKELAFEGDRFHDMQRLKRNIVRSTNYPATSRTVPYTVFRRLFPIPQVEVDANPQIKTQQNAGY
ncbi:MAG: RagB/SusD family nutrient uptake outer membrane protein [Chitinophagaceae bacterium]|nr:MAG: RagB/SusD family nutrient uptake outer membrane protein [Chitinophagaceae bacterium]